MLNFCLRVCGAYIMQSAYIPRYLKSDVYLKHSLERLPFRTPSSSLELMGSTTGAARIFQGAVLDELFFNRLLADDF